MTRPVGGPGVGSNTRAEVVLVNGPSVQSQTMMDTLALFTNTASPTTRGKVFLGDRGYGENRFTPDLVGPGPGGSPAGGAVRPVAAPRDVINSAYPSFPNAGGQEWDVDPSVGMLGLGRLRDLGWR